MPYDVVLDGKSVDHDLKIMPDASRKKVLRAIYERLTVDPFGYGKPLSGRFKGLIRFRVGEWRVIYRIDGSRVLIRNIKLRRDAYKAW